MCLLRNRSKKRKDAARKKKPGKPFSATFSKTRRKDCKEALLEEDSVYCLCNVFPQEVRGLYLLGVICA